MSDTWQDLSDDELLGRLAQRGVSAYVARSAVAARDEEEMARLIEAILDESHPDDSPSEDR